jgi:hypothetical protein
MTAHCGNKPATAGGLGTLVITQDGVCVCGADVLPDARQSSKRRAGRKHTFQARSSTKIASTQRELPRLTLAAS